ncbi:MAG: hypothetical protein IJ685_03975 [Selenomonadaceae bacterium]|nr:hypothetical protein [Selenomonadaceae bacterium]
MAEKDKFADEMLRDEELDGVAGGSIRVPEELAKKAGLTLVNEDGSPGKWGNLWNTGDYYWRGNKISDEDAHNIIHFIRSKDKVPNSIEEVNTFHENMRKNRNAK